MKKQTLRKILSLLPFILVAFSMTVGCTTMGKTKEKASVHLNLGIAYIKAGQYTTALREFIAAEKINPNDAEIHYYMGLTYHGKGMKDKAVGEFKKALSLNPDYSEAHNYLGTVYLEMELYDKAIESFRLAQSNALYETPAVALNNMGWAYYKKGDNKRAIEHYSRAIEKEADTILIPIIHNNMGLAYLDDYNLDEAINHFKRTVEIAPTLAEPQYWLGVCYLKKGSDKRAAQAFRTVVKINPTSRFGLMARERLQALSKGN
jgi:type IV pilus assembly protein PilF